MIVGPRSVRYGIVATICFALSVTLVPLFNGLGLHYVLATIATFCLVAVVGFSLHCRWTFAATPSLESFLRYVSAMALNLPLTVILIGVTHDGIGLSVALSSLVASTLLTLWNFVAVRWAIRDRPAGLSR